MYLKEPTSFLAQSTGRNQRSMGRVVETLGQVFAQLLRVRTDFPSKYTRHTDGTDIDFISGRVPKCMSICNAFFIEYWMSLFII